MKNFKKVIKEINRTLNFLIFFQDFVNTCIIFLSIYLLLSLINLYPILAIVPAVVYFFIKLFVNVRKDKRLAVESKYEPLREKLRTAADNMQTENLVVNELQEDVIHDLKQVGLSSFLDTRRLSYKVFFIILLSFSIVLITTSDLYIVDINKFITELPEKFSFIDPGGKKGLNLELGNINESDNIYGNSKLAVLGNQEIDIKIKPINYEINVKEYGDAEQKEFKELFPSDINIEQGSAFEEDIPEEQQELVKNYFNKLANK